MINYNLCVLSLHVLIIVFMLSLLLLLMVVLLMLLIFYIFLLIFSFCPFVFLPRWWCVVDIKTQELTTFVFILPGSVCHSFSPPPPSPFFFHCALHSGIVHKFTPQELVIGNWIIMPANPQGHLRIMHRRKGTGWNMGFVVKACLSISLKWNLYNFKGG